MLLFLHVVEAESKYSENNEAKKFNATPVSDFSSQLRFCSNCIYQKIFPQFLIELNFFLSRVKKFYCHNNFVKGDNCPMINFSKENYL